MSGRQDITCAVSADAGLKLSPDGAIPTALIVAEAVSNAVEHGFSGGQAGAIAVTVRRCGDRLEIVVADDGTGLPNDFSTSDAASLGLRICTTLAQGLHGQFVLEPGTQGTRARLTLPYA